MFPQIRIDVSQLKDVSPWAMAAARDQVPFASALALTWTGQEVKRALETQMRSVFNSPTPYTMRGWRLFPARKDKLSAEVAFRSAFATGTEARDYLGPQVFGGARKTKAFESALQRVGVMPLGTVAIPASGAKVDRFGNMSRGQIVQLLSYFNAFAQQGYRANMTDKRRAQLASRGRSDRGYVVIRGVEYFVSRGAGEWNGRKQHLPAGIWSRSGTHGASVAPILLFVRRPSYRARLEMEQTAAAVVAERLDANFAMAWARATATSRPVQ